MAKVVFISNMLFENQGIESLSASVKAAGHLVEIMILSESDQKTIVSEIANIKPDFAAFSIISTNYQWALEINSELKKRVNTLSIFGGPHPTYFPEFIENEGVDIICRGDGEEALKELCGRLDSKGDIATIGNLWVKRDGKIFKNNLRPLADVNTLPFLDRDLYFLKYSFLKNLSNKRFLVQRGCPYSCAFCFNHTYKQMYKGLGEFIRFRSPENVISEIEDVISKYPLKTVSFNADSFTLHPEFDKLLEMYKERIGLPFFCNARFNELNEDKVAKLKSAGCIHMALGVESGSDRIRNGLLKRNMPEATIRANAALLKKYKIKFSCYIMFGVPTETTEEAFETVQLCADIKADYVMPTMYLPLIGTDLWEYMKKNGLFEEVKTRKRVAYSNESSVKLENKHELLNLHKLCPVGSAFPSMIPLIKVLVKLPFNPLYQLIFNLNVFNLVRASRNMSWFEMTKLALKLHKSF